MGYFITVILAGGVGYGLSKLLGKKKALPRRIPNQQTASGTGPILSPNAGTTQLRQLTRDDFKR